MSVVAAEDIVVVVQANLVGERLEAAGISAQIKGTREQ